ncbi:MAG: TIGR01244 family sulfur transferase [Qingshengfaniella sp.]
MDIKPLSPDYAVSPQIAPQDMAALKAAGFTTVICNRPDNEIPAALHAQALRMAAEAADLTFIENPVQPGALSEANLHVQAEAVSASSGPVLAYCASGNRSSIVWSFLMAGTLGVDAVLAATTAAGYHHEPLRPQFESFAAAG